MYLSQTEAVSDKYFTSLTPAGWTFSIWSFIYSWQVIHCIYSLTLICRKSPEGIPLYRQPGHIHYSFYIVYIFNGAFNTCWIFIFDREILELAFVFLCFITVTLYICGVLLCKYLHDSAPYLTANGGSKEIWLTRLLPLNGVAFYGTWVTLASLLNFGLVLQYRANVDPDVCSWVVLVLITLELIGWFVLETFVFDKYLRYCFSQYIVLLVAFAGILSNHYDAASPAAYAIYGVVLTALAAALGVCKVIVMIVKGLKYPITY